MQSTFLYFSPLCFKTNLYVTQIIIHYTATINNIQTQQVPYPNYYVWGRIMYYTFLISIRLISVFVLMLYKRKTKQNNFYTYQVYVFIRRMSKPLFIGGLLTHFNPDASDKTELWYAFMCASGLVFSMFATIILVHSTVMAILHFGMKIRVACSSIIFRKVYIHKYLICFKFSHYIY